MNYTEEYKVDVPEAKSGEWKVERFVVKDGIHLMRLMARAARVGETYTRLIHDKAHDPMMSDTPAELRDLTPALYTFRRDWVNSVLINGLGLGIVLKMALAQPHIQHIDVVEISADVIKLVAPSYDDPRVTIHHDDAYTIKWPKRMGWSVAWHDIWPDICTDNLKGMGTLHRRYGQRVAWQDSWQRDNLKSLQRRERDNGWW